jgi:hypothetical protein
MYNDSSSPTLTNVTFTGNSATVGGGMYNDSSSPTLTSVTFSGNTASSSGGGMYNDNSSPELTNVTISGNQANIGGGMVSVRSSPTLTNVTFTGNSATVGGGGMFNLTSSPVLTNVTFSGNSANSSGGGMYNEISSPTLTNVTIAGNSASGSGASGGGMANYTSSPTLQNSIIWGNDANSGGAQVYNDSSTPGYAYSLVQGLNPGGTNLDGTTATPNFVALEPASNAPTPDGDYRLLAGSAAIDAGDNTADLDAGGSGTDTISDIADDLAGNPRVVGSAVDIGAYEAPLFTLTADAGSGQQAFTGETFTSPLVALLAVQDSITYPNYPLAGGSITFSGPASGASTDPQSTTASTNSSGQASASVTANNESGSYNVTANAAGVSGSVDFNLENVLPTVAISATDDSGSETGSDTLTFTLERTGPTDSALDVNISFGGGATNGSDYAALSSPITIPANEANTTITITPIDDSVDETAETVSLTLDSSTDYTVGTAPDDSAEGTIADNDDAPTVAFSEADYTVAEDGTQATITVELTGNETEKEVTVGYATSNGTAGSDDYTSTSGQLTFTPGDRSENFTVAISDDLVDEENETISLTLSNASNATLGTNDTATLTITDDDSAGVSVSKSSLTVSEVGNTGTYEVMLTSQPTATVTIDVSSGNVGEATVEPATLTFTTGNWDEPQTVTVTGVDDDVDDGDIEVSISHSASGGGYDGLSADVTVTVQDNDGPGFTILQSDGSTDVSEGGSDTYTVVLDSEPTADVTISVASSDEGEATVEPTSLTFTASDWDTTQTVTVTGVDDTDIDGTQTVTITHTASSTDSAYDTLDAKEVTVTVADDDSASDPGDPDTTPPDTPEITSPALTDSPTPTIAGTAEPSSTLRLTITHGLDSSVVYTTTVGADGTWSIDLGTTEPISGTFSGLEDGQYDIIATATDAAGNTSEPATQTLTVDIPKPGDPAAPVVTSGNTTDSPTPTISGTAEAGVTITLTIDLGGGASVTYETTADADGNWSIDLANDTPTGGALPAGGLSDGSYPVTVTATNETGSASTQYTLTVQTSTPAAGTTLYLPLIAR